MKKIIYQALALAMTLSLSSCFSDDSSLSSNDVGDITISGISDSYSQVAYMGETLDITPTVESQEDVTYSWLLLSSTTGSKDKDGNEIQPEVIGHEKDLHYEVNLSPGTYQVRLVAQGKSGYCLQEDFLDGAYYFLARILCLEGNDGWKFRCGFDYDGWKDGL